MSSGNQLSERHHSTLRIGDTVMLYYNADKKGSEEAENSGYIISDLSVTHNHSLVLFPSDMITPNLPNIQFGTFKVVTENKYEAQARLELEKQILKAQESRSEDNIISEEVTSVQIAQTEKDVALELNDNRTKLKRLNGKPVFYGDNIQLQHTLTKKYLATSGTETSCTEHTKLKIKLQEHDSKWCIFKILPRYKIEPVGEEVHYQDQVKLESMATEGQFLHCSKVKFGDVKIKVNRQCHELNLAATDSPLTIIHHYQPDIEEETDAQALKGGSTVRLYHKNQNSYVVAEGSFAGIYASLKEIQKIHEMHSDFKTSLAQQSFERSIEAVNTKKNSSIPHASKEKTSNGVTGKDDKSKTIEVRADIEPQAGPHYEWPKLSMLQQLQDTPNFGTSSQRFTINNSMESTKSVPVYYDAISEERCEVIDEDVHFRRKKSGKGIKKFSHTSASTFWQIEKLSDKRSGEPIKWNEKCRIKHLPTRTYLAVTASAGTNSELVVHLETKVSSDNSSTVFVLLPVTHEDSDMVRYESYSNIKHCLTDTWLHFDKRKKYQLHKHGLHYHDGIKESTDLFQLRAAKELNHYDAFVLEEVDDESIANFNYTAGIADVLMNQIKECRLVSLWNEEVHHMHHYCHSQQVIKTLSDLYEFLHEPSSSRKAKDKQKLLRNLKVIQMVVYLIELHRDDAVNDQEMCSACFGVISKYLEGSSSKNKRCTTPMADYLFSATVWRTEFNEEHSIENLLIRMVENSPSLLIGDEVFVPQVAKHLVNKLVQKHTDYQGPCLLDALGVLCQCNGVPIKKNQDQILSYLKEIFQEGHEIFYSLEIRRSNHTKERRKSRVCQKGSGYNEVSIKMEENRIHLNNNSPLTTDSQRMEEASVKTEGVRRNGLVRICKSGYWFYIDDTMQSTEIRYFLSQLRLFVKLCLGDNRKVINALLKDLVSEPSESIGVQITFHHIMNFLQMGIHPMIETIYVELLQVMFVDVGKNRPFLDQLPFSFKLEEMSKLPFADTVGDIQNRGDITALTKVENEYFPDIKAWIEKFLNEMEPLAADQAAENYLLARVLTLLLTLIKYGYYDDPNDIHQPLEKILIIMDGKRDYPTAKARTYKQQMSRRRICGKGLYQLILTTSWKQRFGHQQQQIKEHDLAAGQASQRDMELLKAVDIQMKDFIDSKRFKNERENQSLFQVKKCAIEVLDLLFNYSFYRRLHLFIFDYKSIIWDDYEFNIELRKIRMLQDDPSQWNQSSALSFFSRDKRTRKEKLLACNYPRLVKGARERLQTLLSESELNLNRNTDLPRILLDLVRYEDDDLIQGSLQLLDKYYTSEATIFQGAGQVELLVTRESVELFNNIEKSILSDLREYLDMKNVMGSFQMPISGNSPLEVLTRKCWIQGDVTNCEPHQQNQKIIYNFGVIPSVMEFIQQNSGKSEPIPTVTNQSRRVPVGYNQRTHELELRRKKILTECFVFLRALACGYEDVQKRLLESVNLFLKEVSGDMAPHVARLLREIYSRGPVVTLEIEENIIATIMELIFIKGTRSAPSIPMEGKVEFLKVLEEVMLVQNLSLPVKHNQNVIMKLFNHIRDDERFWCKELLREGMKLGRFNILQSTHNSNEQLQLLLMITDLLASCAVGENASTESVCCTVYTLDEVLQVIVNPNIKLYRKRPFFRFLTWVYVNVEHIDATEKALTLVSNKKLWKCLDNCATMLLKVANKLKRISQQHYLECKECILNPMWKYLNDHGQKIEDTLPFVSSVNGPTNEDYIWVPDGLLFLVEGLLPFLQVFYSCYFDLPSCSQSDPKRVISENICSMLLKFNDPFMKRVYFSMAVQVKLYRRVVYIFRRTFSKAMRIINEFPYLAAFQFEDIEKVTGSCVDHVIKTDARLRYETYYGKETILNEHFHKFVFNYQLAYQGPNTARAQIGSRLKKKSYEKPYSEFLDDMMRKPGHEYLPLGPAFQEHVACFLNVGSLRNRVTCDKIVKDLAERLLKQLEISSSKFGQITSEVSRRKQVKIDIKCLQILRCIIYNHIMLIDPELKERNPKKYRKQCAAKLHPVQRSIQDFGNAISRVIFLLSHPSEEIVYEVLAFLSTILESGNTYVQKGLKDIMNSKENPLFSTLQKMLKQAGIEYCESQSLSKEVKSRIGRDEELGLLWRRKNQVEHLDEMLHSMPTNLPFRSSLEEIPLEILGNTKQSKGRHTSDPTSSSQKNSSSSVSTKRSGFSSGVKNKYKRIPFMTVYQHAQCIPGLNEKEFELICFNDLTHIKLIMKVLGLMCDGQYRDMQNFLREQREKVHNINIVEEVTSFLQVLCRERNIDGSNVKLLHYMLQTLIEMSVGNFANWEVIFNRQVMPIINHILQIDITCIRSPQGNSFSTNESELKPEEYWKLKIQALELKGSVVELLEGMLEETSFKTKELVTQISGGLDIEALHGTLIDFYQLKSDREIIRNEYDDNAQRGLYRTYHVLVHLNYYGVPMKNLEPKHEHESFKIWEECRKSSKSVEVVYKNDKSEEILTKVHFKFDPTNVFREELTYRVKLQVHRHSAEDKLRDFLDWMDVVKKDADHHKKLRERKYTLKPLISFGPERYYILLLLTIVLNILVLLNYDLPTSVSQFNSTTDMAAVDPLSPNLQTWFSDYVIHILGIIHLFFSIWMVLEYFIINWPNFVLPRILFTNSLVNMIRKRLLNDYKGQKGDSHEIDKNYSHNKTWFYKFFDVPKRLYTDVNIFGITTLYVIIFLASSVLSIHFSGYFYCLCLLYIVVNNDILQRALQSITKNAKILLWVAAFIVTVLFIYAVITFAIRFTFKEDDPLRCNSLIQCFMTIIRYGLIEDLGLALPLFPSSYGIAGSRLLFDISFFIIVTIIGLNIVFGIIVDTFSELRNEKYLAEEDMKTVCFICGLHSHQFERVSDHGFTVHVKKQHNMWAYIYFSLYLDQTDISDHNAIERYIHGKMQGGNIDYFPINRALILINTLSDSEKRLDEVRNMLKNVMGKFRSLEEAMDKFYQLQDLSD